VLEVANFKQKTHNTK